LTPCSTCRASTVSRRWWSLSMSWRAPRGRSTATPLAARGRCKGAYVGCWSALWSQPDACTAALGPLALSSASTALRAARRANTLGQEPDFRARWGGHAPGSSQAQDAPGEFFHAVGDNLRQLHYLLTQFSVFRNVALNTIAISL